MTWSDIDLAYVAGFFDGEGSIMIRTSRRPYGRRTYFNVETHVGGCDRESIERLNLHWPGHFSVRTYRNERHNDLWRWHLSAKKAVAFIREIEPFLRLKRPQALLALEFDSLVSPLAKSDDVYARMVEIREEMMKLNARGR